MTPKEAARRKSRRASSMGKTGPNALGRLAAQMTGGSQKRNVGGKVKAGTPNIQESTS